MALGRQTPFEELIHHSDRGSQYASTDYQQILSDNGITSSMSSKGNCYDNAVLLWVTQNRVGKPLPVPKQSRSHRQSLLLH